MLNYRDDPKYVEGQQRAPMMTLGNMRQNGVRTLSVRCYRCHHEARLDVEAYDDAVTVPSSCRAWSARSAVRSTRMPDRTGTSERRLACLAGRLHDR